MDLGPDVPAARPFGAREKWRDVVGNVVLAALGAGLVAVAYAVPGDPVALRVLAAYTAGATLATLALAVAMATTRRLPTVRRVRLDGTPALAVRAWPGEWWYAVTLDAGLVVAAGTLAGLGLAAGGWLVPSLLVGVFGLYFAARLLLAVVGRRRNEAIWLTATEVVHDASWGRERVRREQVTRVRPAIGSAQVVLEIEEPARRAVCPRAWRHGRPEDARIVVDCSWMGLEAADLARWLGAHLGTGSDAASRR